MTLMLFCCTDRLYFNVSKRLSGDIPLKIAVSQDNPMVSSVRYCGHNYIVSSGPLAIEDARIKYSDSSLVPTHKALCILPNSMNQLHALEADTSLIIYYHPFGLSLKPEYIEPSIERLYDVSDVSLVEECAEVEAPEVDDRIIYPVYVLWPLFKPIPQEFDYTELFEVYRADNDYAQSRSQSVIPPPCVAGYLKVYDNRLGVYVPLKNVQMEFIDVFADSQFSSTDQNGYFYLSFADVDCPVTVNLKNDKFVIRDSTTSNVKSYSFYPKQHSNPGYYPLSISNCNINYYSSFFFDTYKAAEYYFYGSNDLLNNVPIYDTLGVSIDIHAINTSGNYLGCFYRPTAPSSPYIYIMNPYTNYSGASSKIFGTVNHELGHATHYASIGNTGMSSTPSVIKESFASFVGWYDVLQYYDSYVNEDHEIVNSICTQGRQSWTPNMSNLNYTPLYIDLYDDYNQHLELSSSYNDDTISSTPLSFIIYCSLGPMNFQSVYNNVSSGVSQGYFTSTVFSTFINPYSIFLP